MVLLVYGMVSYGVGMDGRGWYGGKEGDGVNNGGGSCDCGKVEWFMVVVVVRK